VNNRGTVPAAVDEHARVVPTAGTVRPGRGLALAGAAAALLLSLLVLRALQPRPQGLDELPADAWIYAAISDDPAVFTARPWGYRLLGPWIVHQLGVARGFTLVSTAALALCGPLLFLFLRRQGHATLPALAAVVLFAASAPVGEGLRDPYLCEPLALVLEIAFLLAVESGAGLGVLALVLTLAVLAKEIQVVLVPLVYMARWRDHGHRRALRDAAIVAALPLLASVLLRGWWTSYLHTPYHVPDPGVLPLARARLGRSFGQTSVLLGGLTPLAAAVALLPAARPFLRRYGWLLGLLLVLPFTAWIYDPRPNRVPFFGETVRRLMVYPLPLVLALVLVGVRRLWPPAGVDGGAPGRPRRAWNAAAAALALVAATWPAWGADHYRRVEMLGGLDGAVVRAVCRESIAAARALAAGTTVVFDPDDRARAAGRMGRVRWALREGWGPFPYYGPGPAVSTGGPAALLLPSPGSLDVEARLQLAASRPTPVAISVNGFVVSTPAVGAVPTTLSVRVPARLLLRGDNGLVLDPLAPDVRLELQRMELAPIAP
jgi:hypothetical protein